MTAVKKKVKIIGGSIVGVILMMAIVASVFTPLSVEVTFLQTTTATVSFTEQGVYRYSNTMDVYPMLSGELLELCVSVGEKVEKGDTLAVVSASDVEYEIIQLESSIKGYNAQIYNLALQEQQEKDSLIGSKNNLAGQLASLESQILNREDREESRQTQISLQEEIVARDRSNIRIARDNMRDYRDSDDYERGSYDSEYNALREMYNTAEKLLAASELQLEQLRNSEVAEGYYEGQQESLKAQISAIDTRLAKSYTSAMQAYYKSMIESAESSIQQLAERKGRAAVAAPADGFVCDLPASESNIISNSVSIATIGSEPFVEVFVPIREIDGVQNGDEVRLILDKRLGSETLTGKVVRIEENAQIKISALGVEERKVRVLVKPMQADLHIGFNMDVQFTVFEQPDCVVVPKTAVFEGDGQDMVWVVADGSIQRRTIEKGVETRAGFAIISGLSEGDAVIIDASTSDIAEGKRAKTKG